MNSRFFWSEMANTYRKFGAYQDAIAAYTRALEVMTHPVEQADLWCKIGDIHLLLKNLPEAVSAYHTASDLDPQGHDFASILDRIPQNSQYDPAVIHAIKEMLGLETPADSPAAEADSTPSPASVSEPETDLAPLAEEASASDTQADTLADEFVSDIAPADPLAESASASEPEADTLSAASAYPLTESVPASAAEPEAAPAAEAVSAYPLTASVPASAAEPEAAPAAETASAYPLTEAVPASASDPEAALVAEETASANPLTESAPAFAAEPECEQELVELPIEDVILDPQPLRAALEISELVESVRLHGIIQPLLVTHDEALGKYVVIAGNRRLKAARQAGLRTVPAIIRPATSRQRVEWSLIENTQRSDLNILEQALAFRSLSLHFDQDFEQLAAQVSRPAAHIQRLLSLLRLTESAKQALTQQIISEGHAYALLQIDVPEMQNSVLDFIVANNLSIRQTEDLVLRLVGHPAQPPASTASAAEPETAPAAEETAFANPLTESAPASAAEPEAAPVAEETASAYPLTETVPASAAEPEAAPAAEETASAYPLTESVPASASVAVSQAAVALAVPEPAPISDVMVTEAAPVAQIDQDWDAVLDEMLITSQPEASAPEIMPVHDENGVFDEARFKAYQGISLYERVTSDNPDNDRAWHTLGKYYSEVGQFDKAIQAIKRAIDIDATKDIYYYHLGQAYAASQRYLEAIRAFEQTVALNPQHVFAHCSLAGYYRKLGNDAEAIKHIEIALPNIRQEKAYNQACFEAICGNTDRAIELLKTSLRVDQVPLDWLRRDPDLDFIRDDPRFQQLLSDHESLLSLRAQQNQ